MNYLLQLEKAEHEVRDLEHRLNNVKDGINSIDREIVLLAVKEVGLIENLKNLRKNTSIPLLTEYRRSKDDLNRTQARLEIIRKSKAELEKASTDIVNYLSKSRGRLDSLRSMEVTNVIQFKGKNG